MLFDVQVDQRDGVAVVRVVGELDLASAPQVRTAVVRALASGGPDLELDLTAVDFVDSLGLGVVVSALKRVRTNGGRLVVVVDAARVRKPFEVTGLDTLVDLRGTTASEVAPTGSVDG